MNGESVPLTSFSVPQGYCEWITMPFDLKNITYIFQRRMTNILHIHCCLVYTNGIFVFSKTIEQHKNVDLAINKRCINNWIILGKNKCIYAKQEIEFLGLEKKLEKSSNKNIYILKKRKFFRENQRQEPIRKVSWIL